MLKKLDEEESRSDKWKWFYSPKVIVQEKLDDNGES
jgi:hypothetical protein